MTPAPDPQTTPPGSEAEPSKTPGIGSVVGIGASAGGLQPLKTLIRSLPADFPAAVIVAMHTSPDHPSHLVRILQAETRLRVREAAAEDLLAPGCIYVAPATADVTVVDGGRIRLLPAQSGLPHRIDRMFASIARVFGDAAVVVVLSGSGNDGASAALDVKRQGGIVIAQSEATAEHFAMPSAAIEIGAADIVHDTDDIGPALVAIAKAAVATDLGAEKKVAERILAALQQRRGTRFDEYRPATLFRRLHKRLFVKGFNGVEAYAAYLDKNPDEYDELFDALLINVSRFFRDPEAFDALRDIVVPELLARIRAGGNVRIWCAGCSSGEEPFSIAMLLAEAVPEAQHEHIKIFATDLDQDAISEARAARYDPSRLRGVDAIRRERFFHPRGSDLELAKSIRRMVVFGVNDLSRDPPIGRLDLIVCRNVLIYIDTALQRRILSGFHHALVPDGFLFLGRSEAVPRDLPFAPVERRLRLFRKAPGRAQAAATPHAAATPAPASHPKAAGGVPAALRHVLESGDFVFAVLDEQLRIAFANRYTRNLLGVPTNAEGYDLSGAFADRQKEEFSTAIKQTLTMRRRQRIGTVQMRTKDRSAFLELTADVVDDGDTTHLVLFGHDVTSREDLRATLQDRGQLLDETIEELQTSNHELQASNEELETLNEEFQRANEELATLNEEFQSTNEELETTNEELQSANEELITVNAELEHNAASLDDLERTFRDFAGASDNAVIVLNKDAEVTLWGRRAMELFGESSEEVVGRSVFLTSLQSRGDLLREALKSCEGSRRPVALDEITVKNRLGIDHTIGIVVHARVSNTNAFLGWIVSCRDQTQRASAEASALGAEALLDAVLAGTQEGILVLGEGGKIVSATGQARHLLGLDTDALADMKLWALTDDRDAGLLLRGAVEDLKTKPADEPRVSHAIRVPLKDGRVVLVTCVGVTALGAPPIAVVAPAT